MQRSYLDQYGEGEDQRNRIIVRTIGTVLAVVLASSLLWYLFKNYHQQWIVKSFLASVRSGDLKSAYRTWGCTEAKPCRGYEYDKFLGDWGPGANAPDGPPDLSILTLSDAISCNNGVLLTVTVNAKRTEILWVDKNQDSISFSPFPVCPHRNPWAIMLHRTVGKLRKPLL
jgi:hypothetical protein